MCEANSNKAGMLMDLEVLDRMGGHSRTRPPTTAAKNIRVCVQWRGQWRWRPLDSLSSKTFTQHRNAIADQIVLLVRDQTRCCWRTTIEFLGTGNSTLNGCYTPCPDNIPHSSHLPTDLQERDDICLNGANIVYRNGLKWLYCAIVLVDSMTLTPASTVGMVPTYTWWVGVEKNMQTRKAWGFMRQKHRTLAPKCPWEVNEWLVWDATQPAASRWNDAHETVVCLLTPKVIQDRATTKVITQLEDDYLRRKEQCDKLIRDAKAEIEIHKCLAATLFNNLSRQERRKLAESREYRAHLKRQSLCSQCLSHGEIVRCIHNDCPGVCNGCHIQHNEAHNFIIKTCCACNKKQVLTCPICRESHPVSFMNVFKCRHGVCWQCYAKAFEVKKSISKCPLCRERINSAARAE